MTLKMRNRSSAINLSTPCLVMPIAFWPPKDCQSWHEAIEPYPGLRRPRHADRLAPNSIALSWKGYGRFLMVLEENGLLDKDSGPAKRVTEESVAFYFDELRAAGNADNTIKARLFHLRMALRIMVPRVEFDWIIRPGGVSLDSILQQRPNDHMLVPASKALWNWGLGMLTDKPLPAQEFKALEICRDYRNGLIIALLACSAPRLGSLAQMKVGKNLYKLADEYWVRLPKEIVKNKHHLEYALPGALTPHFDRYLAEIRPLLLDPDATNALWGNGDGGPFTYRSINTMIFRHSKQKFGVSFGPHRFRHALASSLAVADPMNPGLGAVVLGVSEGVTTHHYRKARQADAARKLQAHLQTERERTQAIADRAFSKFAA